jgi:hypothetical protein
MDQFKFRSADEFGIEKSDAAFMARFENNLALERRPQLLKKSRVREILLTSVAGAFVTALLMWVFTSEVGSLLWLAKTHILNVLDALGLSTSAICVMVAFAYAVFDLTLPQIRKEL